jgi:hypothetical protein
MDCSACNDEKKDLHEIKVWIASLYFALLAMTEIGKFHLLYCVYNLRTPLAMIDRIDCRASLAFIGS